MVAHVLFWIGTGLGCWGLLGFVLCVLGKDEIDQAKTRAATSIPLVFLAAAAVAKYIGY